MAAANKGEQAVLERRLRPIYDAVDIGNNKKAIQEADKVLKKHPNTTCAKVLKALALIRSDRNPEAWAILDETDVGDAKFDDNTLQAFTHCYKEAGTPGRIVRLYERVVAREPSEPNLSQLFMAHVRVRDYRAQQQVALRLYREVPNTPYYFWAVMSVVMQAVEDKKTEGQKMFYTLAEKMVRKILDSDGLKVEAEVELFAMILESAGRPADALAFLEGPTGQNHLRTAPANLLATRKLKLAFSAGLYQRVAEQARKLLHETPTEWTLWLLLFDATFKLIDEAVEEEQERLAHSLCDTVDSALAESEKAPGPSRARAARLARLELLSRLRALKKDRPGLARLGTELLGEPSKLLIEYVRVLHSKPACFEDIKMYLGLIEHPERSTFIEQLIEVARTDLKEHSSAEEKREHDSWKLLVYERVRRVLGPASNVERVQHGAEAQANGIGCTARRHVESLVEAMVCCGPKGDLAAVGFAHLAAHVLWDLFTANDDWVSFYELILLLETVRVRQGSSPIAKLLLARAYAHIGAYARVQAMVRELDIKMVQRDTLGYLIFSLPLMTGRFKLGIIHYTELSNLFDQSEREISECLITAYRNGAFTRVPDLVAFGKKSAKSSMAVGADVTNRELSALFSLESLDHIVDTLHGDDENIDWESISDNRDLQVIPSLNPEDTPEALELLQKRTHNELIDSLKLRHLLCRAVASVGRKGDGPKALAVKLEALKAHLFISKAKYPADERPSIMLQAPPPQQLSAWLHGGYIEAVIVVLESALAIALRVTEEKKEGDSNVINDAELVSALNQLLPSVAALEGKLEVFAKEEPRIGGIFGIHAPLAAASRAVQTLAFVQLTLRLLARRVIGKDVLEPAPGPTAPASKKKPIKGPQSAITAPFENAFGELKKLITAAAKRVDATLSVDTETSSAEVLPMIGDDWQGDMKEILSCEKPQVDAILLREYDASICDLRTTIKTLFGTSSSS